MWRVAALVLAVLLVAACSRTSPIYNVEDVPVVTGSGEQPSLEEVRSAIVKAVVTKTWQPETVDANRIDATLRKGRKEAVISIVYSQANYSIMYKDSTLLLYDDGAIHRRYNSWIKGLQKTINRNLAEL